MTRVFSPTTKCLLRPIGHIVLTIVVLVVNTCGINCNYKYIARFHRMIKCVVTVYHQMILDKQLPAITRLYFVYCQIPPDEFRKFWGGSYNSTWGQPLPPVNYFLLWSWHQVVHFPWPQCQDVYAFRLILSQDTIRQRKKKWQTEY